MQQCFLHIENPSTQSNKNDTNSLLSSDDETADSMFDEEDERAVEVATHLENLKKKIFENHS